MTADPTAHVTACPACGAAPMRIFHEERGVPVHSCLLLDSREEAETFPRGAIRLGLCERCGFISNVAFEASHHDYSSRYEETQSFSPLFREFARDLARRWVEKHDLRGKHVLEIGCGKGDFLIWMCEQGAGRGTGIDPAVVPERVEPGPAADRVTWIQDFFDERYLHLSADAVVCRHTLEHLHPVAEFLRLVRRSIGERSDTIVLFDVPDTLRVLREVAFWDVYYEHCSYFTPGSLARLFRATGFEVLDISLDYDGQMILVEARAARPEATEATPAAHPFEEDVDAVRDAVDRFAAGYAAKVEELRRDAAEVRAAGGQAVIWGAGSKGVAYLNALGESNGIEYAVDINPHKHGKFMAGSGQEIVAPDFLRHYRPSVVIAMNPIYRDEIAGDLAALGVEARLVTV